MDRAAPAAGRRADRGHRRPRPRGRRERRRRRRAVRRRPGHPRLRRRPSTRPTSPASVPSTRTSTTPAGGRGAPPCCGRSSTAIRSTRHRRCAPAGSDGREPTWRRSSPNWVSERSRSPAAAAATAQTRVSAPGRRRAGRQHRRWRTPTAAAPRPRAPRGTWPGRWPRSSAGARSKVLVTRAAAELVERHRRSIVRAVLDWWRERSTSATAAGRSTHPETEQVPQTGEPTAAHIVKTEPGEIAAAKVLEARIYGTPLEALCGHVWVPSRDPSSSRCARRASRSTRCTGRSTTG